jgi:CRISPR-associated protein Cas4
MDDWLLNVNDLKHFAYCEAIVFLTHHLGIKETPTEYMMFGKEIEKEKYLQQIFQKYKVTKIHRNVELVSKRLRLAGTPDAILETKHGEFIPVEIKWSEPPAGTRIKRDHYIQLIAYSVLIEEVFTWRKCSVKRAVVFYLKPQPKFFEVTITYEDKRMLISTLERALRVAKGLAEPKLRKDCTDCNYKAFCPYLH